MNDMLIVTVFVTLDDLLRDCNYRPHSPAKASDSDTAQRAPAPSG